MGKSNRWIWFVLGIGIIVFFFVRFSTSDKPKEPNNSNNGGSNGNGTPIPPPTATTTPSIKDYIGKTLIANRDNIKIYYNNDLSEAKTFYKGENMGWLGEPEINNTVCPNRKGFYKVWDSGVSSWCDVVISEEAVKGIFNIA